MTLNMILPPPYFTGGGVLLVISNVEFVLEFFSKDGLLRSEEHPTVSNMALGKLQNGISFRIVFQQ